MILISLAASTNQGGSQGMPLAFPVSVFPILTSSFGACFKSRWLIVIDPIGYLTARDHCRREHHSWARFRKIKRIIYIMELFVLRKDSRLGLPGA